MTWALGFCLAALQFCLGVRTAEGETTGDHVDGRHLMKFAKAFAVPFLLLRLRTTPNRPKELVDLVLSSNLIRPVQVREELLEFAHVVNEVKPKLVLEIGTLHGGTLCLLSRLADP